MKKGTYVEMMVYPEFILSIKSKMLYGYTELIEKYKVQLELYKRALEKSLKRRVDKVYIYSMALGKEIKI